MTQTPNEPNDEIPPEVLALHPVTMRLVQLMTGGENGQPFELTEELLVELVHELYARVGHPELLQMYYSLSGLAMSLRQHNSSALAKSLQAILEHDEVGKAIKELKVSADPAAVAEVARKFSSFVGREESLAAPKTGEPRPEGTITTDQLKFPRRM